MLAMILAMTLVPLQPGEMISSVAGNWAGPTNDGFHYRAELYANGDHVGLRICQSIAELPASCPAEAAEFDVPQIQYLMTIGVNLVNALTVNPDGSLTLTASSEDEAYGFTEAVTIQLIDNQFTVMRYDMESRPLTLDAGEMTFACSVDLWEGRALVGGNPDWTGASFEDRNAAYWTPDRIHELGACPVVN